MLSPNTKGMLADIARFSFNSLYRLFGVFGRRDEVLFVSRKSDEPSYDYLECGAAFEERGLKPVYLSQHFKSSSVGAYAGLVLKELYHLARCKVCVIDRYDPVVSLINFKCESGTRTEAGNNEFPVEPVVIQLWHAFGAFKKFGCQSLDVVEGHSSEEASRFSIHRNNSWVVCSGEGARAAFAEAFDCPVERVVPLSRPEYRKLLNLRGSNEADGLDKAGKPVVLFAPTIRKYDKALNPFEDLRRNNFEAYYASEYRIQWSDHPLAAGDDAKGDVPVALLSANMVVTDYSSIVYEAFLLGKMALFYVPDIAHYRKSPGLNIDPQKKCPSLVARTEKELDEKIRAWVIHPEEYPWHEFQYFVGQAFEGSGLNPATDLVSFVQREYPDLLPAEEAAVPAFI